MPSPETTRFAPSPTGLLHLGHAYSALHAHGWAERTGGRFLVRIEDIDHTRCRAEHEEALLEDLAWLGLESAEEPWRQSERLDRYAAGLERLEALGVLYPCFCTRREMAFLSAPHGSVLDRYAGTCRGLSDCERSERRQAGQPYALRLDSERAFEMADGPLVWEDQRHGPQEANADKTGDVVLARKDIGTSYHLAVTIDDAAQGITLVTRGEDLLDSTHVHRVLQELLELEVPRYEHHRLIADDEGRRLAKRDESTALRVLRESGLSAADLRARLGFGG